MATILIIGAGVMGAALAVPAAHNGHRVLLAGTPLDGEVIARLKQPGGVHPRLDAPLPAGVTPLADAELTPAHVQAVDLVILGVSSPGADWAVTRLNRLLEQPRPVACITKGLDRLEGRVITYAHSLPPRLARASAFIGIGGPCIARELANCTPTLSVYASPDRAAAAQAAALLRTPFYRLALSEDLAGVEACAALKNFYAIGVSAMQTRYRDAARADGQAKNPAAAAFTLAVHEMARLCEVLGGQRATAFDLAGAGDLHVTVGGGRNSRLGHALGRGELVAGVMAGALAGETVEGIDTARHVQALLAGLPDGADRFPLAAAIIAAVVEGTRFEFDFATVPA